MRTWSAGKLENAILQQESELETWKRRIGGLDRENKRSEDKIKSLESEIATFKAEEDLVNQDLAAILVHAPDEGAILEAHVVMGFEEVTEYVVELARTFLEWLRPHINRSVSQRHRRDLVSYFQQLEGMQEAGGLLERASGSSLSSISEILLRHFLCLALYRTIFRPLLPGGTGNDPATQFLSKLSATAHTHESQDRYGRWRALTYKYARELDPRDEGWYTELVRALVKDMSDFMELVSDNALQGENLDRAFQLTLHLFDIASRFKDRVMKFCIESDMMVYLPRVGDDFLPQFMNEACQGNGHNTSKKVVIAVGLGLQLASNSQKGSTYNRRYKYPILAHVIGDKSSFFPSKWFG